MDIPTTSPLLPGFATRPAAGTDNSDAVAPAADFQSFLTLLTSQLRNQDPLQPLDSTQFVAQLASFSTVEQLVGTNSRLDLLTAQAENADLAALGNWIGRLASTTDGSFRATGTAETFQVPALAGADRIEAVAVLSDGTELERFAVAADASGRAIWAGGAAVAPRTPLRLELFYSMGGQVIERRPAGVFREVTGVRGTPEGLVLDLSDGGAITPAKVAELRAPTLTILPATGN